MYELLVSMAAAIAVAISGLVGSSILVITGEATIEKTDDDINGEEAELNIPMPYKLALGLFGAFLNAFVVAGLVEELGKYLCFWMCEHPDLVDKEVVMETNPTIENANAREDMELLPPDETSQSLTPPVSASLVSRGSAITIAMVATSLGFACAENLLYVFVYTPPGIDAELSTLIVRCMFPVHPLAAALQSIGVCRRDLEGDKSTQVGRILYVSFCIPRFVFLYLCYII